MGGGTGGAAFAFAHHMGNCPEGCCHGCWLLEHREAVATWHVVLNHNVVRDLCQRCYDDDWFFPQDREGCVATEILELPQEKLI